VYTALIDHSRITPRAVFLLQTEKLSHADLDQRALDALKEFPADGALAVLKQFLESNLVGYLTKVVDPD
jgi:hypothetical protein